MKADNQLGPILTVIDFFLIAWKNKKPLQTHSLLLFHAILLLFGKLFESGLRAHKREILHELRWISTSLPKAGSWQSMETNGQAAGWLWRHPWSANQRNELGPVARKICDMARWDILNGTWYGETFWMEHRMVRHFEWNIAWLDILNGTWHGETFWMEHGMVRHFEWNMVQWDILNGTWHGETFWMEHSMVRHFEWNMAWWDILNGTYHGETFWMERGTVRNFEWNMARRDIVNETWHGETFWMEYGMVRYFE